MKACIEKLIEKLAFTPAEREEYHSSMEKLLSMADYKDKNYKLIKSELELAVIRDIQAKRLPPDVKVPSRKKALKYIKTIYYATGSLKLALRSLLYPGSWTSSGGSFKLAEEAGYDITEMMLKIEQEKGTAKLLEIGAGYAGFKSREHKGIRKLVEKAGDKIGKSIFAYMTNLTKWHEHLPNGVVEFSGYRAKDISMLKNKNLISNVDIIYSQCGAYFEPEIEEFVIASSELLSDGGMLIFNAKPSDNDKILKVAEKCNLKLQEKFELNNSNGNLYVFKKI